jgi:hypothetical protein
MNSEYNNGPTHDEIARVAYEIWKSRAGDEGSPETDWYEAEELLRGKAGEEGEALGDAQGGAA